MRNQSGRAGALNPRGAHSIRIQLGIRRRDGERKKTPLSRGLCSFPLRNSQEQPASADLIS
eukprot:2044511-Pleurochrysis_carterae.AAC.1